MKRTVAVLLAMMTFVLLLSGCQVNREKDMAQVIIQVGDVSHTKRDVYDFAMLLYRLNGYDVDFLDNDLSSEEREQVDLVIEELIPSILQQELAVQVVDRDMPLTEEETKEVEDSIQEYVDYVKTYQLGYDPEHPEEYEGDVEADVAAFFETEIVPLEQYRDLLLRDKKQLKLEEHMREGIAATEEQVQTQYNTDLAAQKEAIATSETSYETLTQDGSSLIGQYTLHKGYGYRMVKHVLLAFNEEEQQEVTAANTTLSDLESRRTSAETEKSTAVTAKTAAEEAKATAESEGNAEEVAAQDAIIAEQTNLIAEKDAAIAQLEQEQETARQAKFALLSAKAQRQMGTAQNIVTRAKEGEEFMSLVKEYGEDPGMEEGNPAALYGYLIPPDGAGYDQAFGDAVIQMNEAGGVSDPVVGDYGIHIITLLYGTEATDIPLDVVKSLVRGKADTAAQTEAVTTAYTAYEAEWGAKSYAERAKWIKGDD